jgi:hypothetical protein
MLATITSAAPPSARVRRGARPMAGATTSEASMVNTNSADIRKPAWAASSLRSFMIALIRKGSASNGSRPTP